MSIFRGAELGLCSQYFSHLPYLHPFHVHLLVDLKNFPSLLFNMVDPITGIGLASSILTLAEAGYKISRRTIEFSRLLGELPPDLQECSNFMDVLVRTAKRLQAQLKAEGAGIGPITALHADLESLFDQCNRTALALLSFLERIKNSNSLSKAIQMTRKEGEIVKIRNKLDDYILALLLIFEEHQQVFNEDFRYFRSSLSHIKPHPAERELHVGLRDYGLLTKEQEHCQRSESRLLPISPKARRTDVARVLSGRDCY